MADTYKVELPDARYFARQVLCREHCPVGTDSGGYVQAIAAGNLEEAYIIARTPNPFASICGRVCAAPCEAQCRRETIDAAVSIRALKRYVCEQHGVESTSFNLRKVYPSKQRAEMAKIGAGRKVAIVGAGPAGLSCAHDLALMGFTPTVFEAQQISGGMLMLGVPEYRLPREVIQAEIDAIKSLGVEIRHGQRLGKDFLLADLKRQGFESVFLGIGAHKSRELGIAGIQYDGVLRAIDFLLNVNLGYRVTLGRKVVVIGGGNVAFDVARSVLRQAERVVGMSEPELRATLQDATAALDQLTNRNPEVGDQVRLGLDVAREAIRKGVPEVHMYCLESLDEIPAAREEIEEAKKEGIHLHTRYGPKLIYGQDGRMQGVELVRCSRVFDDNRRFNPQFMEGSEERIDCDTVVLAIGQTADLSWIKPEDNLKLTPRGGLQTDPQTLATSRPDVFAGGDLAFGPRIIITAVAEGKRAARQIAGYLTGNTPAENRAVLCTTYPKDQFPRRAGYETAPRLAPPMLPIERRIGIAEVELSYAPAAAKAQADRCLQCHMGPVFNGDECILCGGCADVCPESCLRLVDTAQLLGDARLQTAMQARYGRSPRPGEHGAIIKDEARCIRCGLCAVRCPTGAITMERIDLLPALT